MNKILIGIFWTLIFSTTLVLAESDCDVRYANYNEATNNAYLELELECYPDVMTNTCEFELTPECLEKYEQLSITTSLEFESILADCPDLFENINPEMAADSGVITQRAPTKRELLNRIKKLEKRNKKLKSRLTRECR